jgi:hypothetical protein
VVPGDRIGNPPRRSPGLLEHPDEIAAEQLLHALLVGAVPRVRRERVAARVRECNRAQEMKTSAVPTL